MSHTNYQKLKNIFEDQTDFINPTLSGIIHEEYLHSVNKEGIKEYWKNRGNLFYKQTQFPEAIVCYYKSLSIDPDYSDVWHNITMAINKIENIIPIFDKILINNDQFQNRLSILKDSGIISRVNYQKLKNIFEDPIDFINPTLSGILNEEYLHSVSTEGIKEYWKNRGNLFYKQNQFPEAIICYYKSLRVDPDYSDAWHNITMTTNKIENISPIFDKKSVSSILMPPVVRINPEPRVPIQVINPTSTTKNSQLSHAFKDGEYYASAWDRWFAYILDFLLILVILAIPAYFIITIFPDSAGIVFILAILIYWLYFAISEAGNHQATLGKRALKIYVTDDMGEKISNSNSFLRSILKLILTLTPFSLLALINGLSISNSVQGKGLHDYLSKTLILTNKITDKPVISDPIPKKRGLGYILAVSIVVIILIILSVVIAALGFGMAAYIEPSHKSEIDEMYSLIESGSLKISRIDVSSISNVNVGLMRSNAASARIDFLKAKKIYEIIPLNTYTDQERADLEAMGIFIDVWTDTCDAYEGPLANFFEHYQKVNFTDPQSASTGLILMKNDLQNLKFIYTRIDRELDTVNENNLSPPMKAEIIDFRAALKDEENQLDSTIAEYEKIKPSIVQSNNNPQVQTLTSTDLEWIRSQQKVKSITPTPTQTPYVTKAAPFVLPTQIVYVYVTPKPTIPQFTLKPLPTLPKSTSGIVQISTPHLISTPYISGSIKPTNTSKSVLVLSNAHVMTTRVTPIIIIKTVIVTPKPNLFTESIHPAQTPGIVVIHKPPTTPSYCSGIISQETGEVRYICNN